MALTDSCETGAAIAGVVGVGAGGVICAGCPHERVKCCIDGRGASFMLLSAQNRATPKMNYRMLRDCYLISMHLLPDQ